MLELDGQIDSLVGWFERELSGILATAQSRTIAELSSRLRDRGGRLARSASVSREIRRVDRLFRAEMDRAGYSALVREFTGQFPGLLPLFRSTLEHLRLPEIRFGAADFTAMEQSALGVVDALEVAVDVAASAAKRQALLGFGGLRFPELAEAMSTQWQRSIPQAVGLAETAMATHYRVIADRGFAWLERETGEKFRYLYEGPRDKLTRPFCRDVLRRTRREPMTRAEIDRLDNGQLPNVFITGGGFRCRHQWVLSARNSTSSNRGPVEA